MKRRVVVAMSGGVDSSVAAAMLHGQGFEMIGVGLKLHDVPAGGHTKGTCCGLAGMEDARRVAAQIGIPFYVLNYETVFSEEVIEPFCRAYAAGKTPNPCVLCNARVKFGPLLRTALTLGADYLATGHYARVEHGRGDGGPLLRKGLDGQRDQSYFLHSLTLEMLAHALFPLGNLKKAEVRAMARSIGLHVSGKPSSQDICFVQGASYRQFLACRHPEAFRPGPIVNSSGQVLGRHRGIGTLTVGQRRGLGIAAGRPLYVIALDAERNTVMVGPKEETRFQTLTVGQVNWLVDRRSALRRRLNVKTRYRTPGAIADITLTGNGHVVVRFDRPQGAVAPGQSAVFYHGDTVIGGGVIESYEQHSGEVPCESFSEYLDRDRQIGGRL